MVLTIRGFDFGFGSRFDHSQVGRFHVPKDLGQFGQSDHVAKTLVFARSLRHIRPWTAFLLAGIRLGAGLSLIRTQKPNRANSELRAKDVFFSDKKLAFQNQAESGNPIEPGLLDPSTTQLWISQTRYCPISSIVDQ